MQYDLSIIIAHFRPKDLENNPLIKTINEINNQKNQYEIEIIIADDGSLYNYPFQENYSTINNSVHQTGRCQLEPLLTPLE